jgi:hypothetical protein
MRQKVEKVSEIQNIPQEILEIKRERKEVIIKFFQTKIK